MTKLKEKLATIFAITAVVFSTVVLDSCKKDDDATTGSLTLKMTDAPVDNAEVKGVFVTVTDVKVDGQSVEGFSKTTFDLSAYQNGKTETLFSSDMEAKTYSEITLVFDNEKDADGNSPGTYVLKEDGSKDQLSANATSEFSANTTVEVNESSQASTVIDFDLRKAIRTNSSNDDDYEFTSSSSVVVRAVDENEAGSIEGEAKDESAEGIEGHIVVYAYKKGDYNEGSETSGEIMFEKSVSSAMVNADGSYKLAFLEKGDYEVYFANYTDEDNDGKFEFEGMLKVDLGLGLDLFGTVTVDASSSATLNLSLKELI